MSVEERSVPGTGRRAWGPRLLILAGIVLLAGTLGWFAILAPLQNPAPLPIPAHLAGLPLTRHAFGRQAADEIARLHDSRFPLTGATVAEYGDGAAIVWASQTWGRWGARYMTRSMTRAIERETTPFTPTGQRVVDGRTVYALRGMGMSHFYFQASDQVIWLAASPDRADAALR
ncbi:MAG: hypothetical protein ACE5F6_19065, partial [Anaerolineae bacterium]